MKKYFRIIAIMIICVMMAGCGATTVKRKNEDKTQQGFDTKEDLIKSYLGWLNGSTSDEEFYKYFDKDLYVAYWLTEDMCSETPTIADALLLINDINAQTEDVKTYIKKYDDAETNMKKYVAEASQNYKKWGPYEQEIKDESIWESDYGYYRYRIYVNDDEVTSISLLFANKDGKYYWIMPHETV